MSQSIKFCTYNTHLFMGEAIYRRMALYPQLAAAVKLGNPDSLKSYNEDERLNQIKSYFNPNNFDVIGFCEVWLDAPRERICEGFPYHFFEPNPYPMLGNGLVLASKYEFLEKTFVQFNNLAGFDFFSTKGFIRAVIRTPGGDVRIYFTHTQASDDESETRKKNLEQIENDMRNQRDHLPVIVMGDLNVPGETEEYTSKPGVLSSMTDAFESVHRESAEKGWTWDASNHLVEFWDPGATGGQRLDYILFSADSDWSVSECVVENGIQLSDHYALRATLTLLTNKTYQILDTWEDAKLFAEKVKEAYGFGASTLVIVTNDTDGNIHLVQGLNWDGSFYTPVPTIIPAGKSAGLLHVHPAEKAIGSKGCIIMRQGEFDYFLGFHTPHDASKNKVYVECRGNGHWWAAGSQDNMSDRIDNSSYTSSNAGVDANNKYMKVKSGTQTGTSPLAWFTITSREDPRPVPILHVSGGDFKYDGQSHPVKIDTPTFTISIPLVKRTFNLDGNFKITYDPGNIEPKDAGTYTAQVTFRSNPVRPILGLANLEIKFQDVAKQATIKIDKADPRIVLDKGEFTYNENPHPVTASVTGVSGEKLPMTIRYQGTTKAGDSYGPTGNPPIVAGEYQVTVSTSGDKNHNGATKVVPLIIKPAPAKVTAPEALEVRKGHSTHTNNIGHWLKHGETIEVWDIWRGEDEVWVQHDNSGQRGPGWSAMEYEGRVFVEFITTAEAELVPA